MRTIFVNLLLLSSCYNCISQSLTDKIVASLDSFTVNRPQEKTYLQTDRNTYLVGETIFFKAYNVLYQKPSILSKVIYTELADATGKILQKKMMKLINGSASGSIDIDSHQAAGNYYLRCYTLWMLNFPSFISQKQIAIINNGNSENKSNAVHTSKIQLSFFPEGGDLINNIKSVVAFKAIDENNNPAATTGDIINNKNEIISTFKTSHDGMGIFEITPVINENYKANIHNNNTTKRDFNLPIVKDEGIVITVDNSNNNKVFFKATRSEKNKSLYNNLLVVAQLNYQVVYMNKLNIDEGLDALAINKKNLTPGIMQITVMTENGKPLAERLVFIANHSIKDDLIQPALIDNQKRKKNIIIISTTDFSNLNAAISITNSLSEPLKNHPSILSSLLLTSDIKGNINDAGYYFKDKDSVTLSHLDLIMLTNGWRRFNYEEIIVGKFSQLHYPFETGLSISGKILQSNGKTGLKAGRISMIIKGEDSTTILSEAKINDVSIFVVDNIEFKKEATIYYQGINEKKQNALVSASVNAAYFDTLKAVNIYPENSSSSSASNILFKQISDYKLKSDSTFGKVLPGVFVKAKRRSVTDSLNSLYASNYYFDSDQTLAVDENSHYYDIWQFLQRSVPGISINKTDTGTQVNFSRYAGLDVFGDGPNSSVQFYLNEVPVSVDVIDALNPSDVGLVKVFKGTSAIAIGASRGAIAMYTKKGVSTRDWRDKGFEMFKKSGFSVTREFYYPDYSKQKSENIVSDLRPTLYWNPQVKITDNKAVIEFYNDDVCKKFNIIIEGIDEKGKLLHAEKNID